MSESTRADLRISNCDANCDHSLPVTDSEFTALVRQWIVEHPAEAMRELFTEPCGTCDGSGLDAAWTMHTLEPVDCDGPDCKGGRVLKDGVWDEWWCDAPPYAKQHGGCQPGDDFYPHRHDLCGQRVSFPAEWMEASDGE